MDTNTKNMALELAAVTLVGFGLAQASKRIPVLNENTMFTRTSLYVLGFVIAAHLRPQGGYKLIEG